MIGLKVKCRGQMSMNDSIPSSKNLHWWCKFVWRVNFSWSNISSTQVFSVTDSPGTAFISDASNMRVKGQRSLNFGSKFRFDQLLNKRRIVIWNLVGRIQIEKKLFTASKLFCFSIYLYGKGQVQRSKFNVLYLKMQFSSYNFNINNSNSTDNVIFAGRIAFSWY